MPVLIKTLSDLARRAGAALACLILCSGLIPLPAEADTCRTDSGFLHKLTQAQAHGRDVLAGVGTILPKGTLPAPPQPFGLDPETGEIIPSARPGPITARFRFSGDLHGPEGRTRSDDLDIVMSIGCAGFTCAVFPATPTSPLTAYFVFVRRDGALHLDGGPCKGFSRTLTEARAEALLSCAKSGCRPQDWAAFCDRRTYLPMHACIAAGLLVRDQKSGRFVPSQR